uniref:Uncharacterized protein n=1 Tax=Heterorhabditis bacteriophora TaxID=37862 RepID=A0A1I7WA06_HETBA
MFLIFTSVTYLVIVFSFLKVVICLRILPGFRLFFQTCIICIICTCSKKIWNLFGILLMHEIKIFIEINLNVKKAFICIFKFI